MTQSHAHWSPSSPSFLNSAALAAFMLFLGARGLVAPESAAQGFGFAVADPSDAVWLRIKGDRDQAVALGIGAFLALRWRRALGVLLLASIPSPLLDCIISLATPGHDTAFALTVHGGAAVLVAALGVVLFREHSGTTTGAETRSARAAG